jgi:hypothetical protein
VLVESGIREELFGRSTTGDAGVETARHPEQ